MSRRQFLARLLRRGGSERGRGAAVVGRVRRGPGHPTPRPGITAANVLPDSDLVDFPACTSAFQAVRQVPQIVDGIRCQCGCADLPGFYSLLVVLRECRHGRMCEICQGEGRWRPDSHGQGKTLDEIRAAIDARYG